MYLLVFFWYSLIGSLLENLEPKGLGKTIGNIKRLDTRIPLNESFIHNTMPR